jgi:hypothetical protein
LASWDPAILVTPSISSGAAKPPQRLQQLRLLVWFAEILGQRILGLAERARSIIAGQEENLETRLAPAGLGG